MRYDFALPDYWGTYPYTDIYFRPKYSTMINTRQTYSLLDLLGDVGGLNDALFLILEILMKSYSEFAKASILLTSLFRFKPSLGP